MAEVVYRRLIAAAVIPNIAATLPDSVVFWWGPSARLSDLTICRVSDSSLTRSHGTWQTRSLDLFLGACHAQGF